jgi:hypothetical protein
LLTRPIPNSKIRYQESAAKIRVEHFYNTTPLLKCKNRCIGTLSEALKHYRDVTEVGDTNDLLIKVSERFCADKCSHFQSYVDREELRNELALAVDNYVEPLSNFIQS